jgi:hypothetical protein
LKKTCTTAAVAASSAKKRAQDIDGDTTDTDNTQDQAHKQFIANVASKIVRAPKRQKLSTGTSTKKVEKSKKFVQTKFNLRSDNKKKAGHPNNV